jgi:lysophospholipase L1-like esterase
MPPTVELPTIAMGRLDKPVPVIIDGAVLRPFFAKVARLLRGEAEDHIRIAVYGDSNLTRDHLTGQMRRTLQQRYGDAGHGFVALGRPWSHYLHMDVQHGQGSGWEPYASSTDPVIDNVYGISGIAVESVRKGAAVWVATAEPPAPVGRTVSRLNVFYLKDANLGSFDILVDGERNATVNARAPHRQLGVQPMALDDAPHRIELVATSWRGRTRLLGITLERGDPSFVIDSFGVAASNSVSHARQDPAINAAMLQQRAYDLVIFATGANDVFTLDAAPEAMRRIIEQHRQALPDIPILILSPSDRGRSRTFPLTLRVVEQRRQIAVDNGTAFWSVFEAMGGRNSMRAFKRRGLAEYDYVHFTKEGGAYLGDRLVYALWRELDAYLTADPSAGCEPEIVWH